MSKNETVGPGRARVAVCLAVAMAGCCPDDDIDPNVLARSLAAMPRQPVPVLPSPELVTCEVPLPSASATPIAETASRKDQPALRQVEVAVGRSAAVWMTPLVERAFAAASEVETRVTVCSDRDAVEFVMVGRAGFALMGGKLSDRDMHAGLRQTRLGLELFALTMRADSPVRSLSRTQVRQVFTGQATHWHQLGFDGGAIVAVVPGDRCLGDRAARALIPGDDFASICVRAANDQEVADQLLQHKGAIGIVRVTGERRVGEKALMIDWSPPTLEAYGYGTYPFGIPLNLVTSGQPAGVAKAFVDFFHSEVGTFDRALLR